MIVLPVGLRHRECQLSVQTQWSDVFKPCIHQRLPPPLFPHFLFPDVYVIPIITSIYTIVIVRCREILSQSAWFQSLLWGGSHFDGEMTFTCMPIPKLNVYWLHYMTMYDSIRMCLCVCIVIVKWQEIESNSVVFFFKKFPVKTSSFRRLMI